MTISDQLEQTWILDSMTRLGASAYWLGVCESAGNFAWGSGEPFTFTSWAVGHPHPWFEYFGTILLPNGTWITAGDNSSWPNHIPAFEVQELSSGQPIGWSFPVASPVAAVADRFVCADLTGDRLGDLLLIDPNSLQIAVMVGDGQGAFTPVGSLSLLAPASDAVVADVNSDARPDVIVAHPSSTQLSSYLGVQGGGWLGPYAIPVGRQVDVVVCGDVTGDWIPDLVCASSTQATGVDVLSGNGAGQFTPTALLGAGQCSGPLHLDPSALAGSASIAAVRRDAPGVRIYRQSATGTFLVEREIPTQAVPIVFAFDRSTEALAWSAGGSLYLTAPFLIADVSFTSFAGIRTLTWIGPQRLFVGAASETVICSTDNVGSDVASAFRPLGVQAARYAVASDFDNDGRPDVLSLRESGPTSIGALSALGFTDCNANLVDDPEEIAAGTVADCNGNHLVDACELAAGTVVDCNSNGVPDACDVALGTTDCDDNGIPDTCDISVADCNGNGVPDSCDVALGATDCNGNGLPDTCDISAGTAFDCDGTGTIDPCDIASNPTLDLNIDGRIDSCQVDDEAGVPFCFGDGSGVACPCDPGQIGPPGSGCRNSFGLGGRLTATGIAAITVDLLRLRALDLPPTAIGMFFQGTFAQSSGTGTAFGDGLLCVNGTIRRLGIRSASGGTSSLGYGNPGDQAVSVNGAVPAGGGLRYYQLWYRDPAAFCTPSTFNLTNAVRLDWTP